MQLATSPKVQFTFSLNGRYPLHAIYSTMTSRSFTFIYDKLLFQHTMYSRTFYTQQQHMSTQTAQKPISYPCPTAQDISHVDILDAGRPYHHRPQCFTKLQSSYHCPTNTIPINHTALANNYSLVNITSPRLSPWPSLPSATQHTYIHEITHPTTLSPTPSQRTACSPSPDSLGLD